MAEITKISALEILDSRGNWTIETSLEIDGQYRGAASVPSGASVGSYEKKALPPKTCLAAINGLLGPRLLNEEFSSLQSLDDFLVTFDSSNERSSLGANTLLSISAAFCKALAKKENVPSYKYIANLMGESSKLKIPQPIFNIVNGGRHAKNDLDFQEFIIMPRGTGSFESQLEQAATVFHSLGNILDSNGFTTELGDEGGFAPKDISYEGVLNFISESAKQGGIIPGKDMFFGIDVAAATLALGDLYNFERLGQKYDSEKLTDLYLQLCQRYPINYLEDPFGQDSFSDFQQLKSKVKNKVEIAGDDLIVTNLDRLKKAIKLNSISCVIIKPNQIGTISESLEVVKFAKINGISTVGSHRSGETDDDFIADFSVGGGCNYIKAGAPARGERVAKYNRLLEIEKEISGK